MAKKTVQTKWSTNKMVRPGDPNTTGAKTEKPPRTRKQQKAADAAAKAVAATKTPTAKRNDKFLGAVTKELDKQKKTGVIKDKNLLRNLDEARKRKILRTMT
jgi:hypothetical protein